MDFKPDKTIKVLSLFSGCGGMDLGFEGGFEVHKKSINSSIHPEWILDKNDSSQWLKLPHTIFKTIFANDIFPAARASWVPFFEHRGCSKEMFHLKSIVDLVKKFSEGEFEFPSAEVITGGFPCQDFSVAGKRKGFKSHKGHHGVLLNEDDNATEENRGKLYIWMKRVIEIVKPKVFIAENVKGLVSLADSKQVIENDFRNIDSGYHVVDARVLAAPDFGVPQTRERVFFIGLKKDALTDDALIGLQQANCNDLYDPYPSKTHGEYAQTLLNENNLMPYVTLHDYLNDLPEPENSSDPSQQSFSKAKYYGKHCQGQLEVDLFGLSPTIRSEHHGNIEFRRLSKINGGILQNELDKGLKERRLTVRECARIQTFPDSFDFVRHPSVLGKEYKVSTTDGYKLIGNAVPPLLAFHLAWRLQELWCKLFKD